MIHIIDKSKCCACGACMSICPKKAIVFEEDEFGNQFPYTNTDLCINCSLCESVCPYINKVNKSSEHTTYAVKLKNESMLLRSASGGAFYGLAAAFINHCNGVVYGCAFDDQLNPYHCKADNVEELNFFQGSKYVRSTVSCYKEIKDTLKSKSVLFCGTPCQCAAVKLFCNNSERLITIELICHGVIDQSYWLDYIDYLSKKRRTNRITNYTFRSKDKGGNFVGSYVGSYVGSGGCQYDKNFSEVASRSYYYSHFLEGKVFRENCYHCDFASSERVADITIGDFWGYSGKFDVEKGLSVLICNNIKGMTLFEIAKGLFEFEESIFEKAAKANEQLRIPFSEEKKDYSILRYWKKHGTKWVAYKFYSQKAIGRISRYLKIKR